MNNNKWNILINKIKDYLIKVVKKFTFDISYDMWNKYNYDDSFEEYFELIEDISTIIDEILYNNKSKIIIKNISCIYIFSPDGCISNLVSWKITNNNDIIIIRIGAFGNVCYIKIYI